MPVTLKMMKAAIRKVKELTESYALLTKGKAKYNKAEEATEDRCKACRFFRAYISGYDDTMNRSIYDYSKPGTCNLVEGEIEPEYTCAQFEMIGAPVLESEFSFIKASQVDRKELPESAFLIKDRNMPLYDKTGKVNIGFLNAAHALVTSGSYKGKVPEFVITKSAQQTVAEHWDIWQLSKKTGDSETIIAESISDLDYLQQGIASLPGKAIKNPAIAAQSVDSLECILQDYVWRTYAEASQDLYSRVVVESIDKENRTAVIIAIESGWSLNKSESGLPRFYQKSAVRDFAEHLQERPNIYAEHVVGTDAKSRYLKMNRPMAECVAIVVEEHGVRQAWYEETSEGTGVAKAKVRFTNRQVGKETWEEVLEDPKSVQFSVNARTYVNPKAMVEGVKCESIEGVQMLYSLDNVGYAAAKGRIASVSASIAGVSESLTTDSNGVIAQVEVAEGAYYSYSDVEAAASEPNASEEDDYMFNFKTLAEAIANSELLTAFKAHFKVDTLETENSALKEQVSTLTATNKELTESINNTRTRAFITEKVQAVRDDKKEGIANFSVSEAFIEDALRLEADQRPENYDTLTAEGQAAFLTKEQKIEARINERVADIKQVVAEAIKNSGGKSSNGGTIKQTAEAHKGGTGLESSDATEAQADVKQRREGFKSAFKKRF